MVHTDNVTGILYSFDVQDAWYGDRFLTPISTRYMRKHAVTGASSISEVYTETKKEGSLLVAQWAKEGRVNWQYEVISQYEERKG